MRRVRFAVGVTMLIGAFVSGVFAQIDDFCTEAGFTPSLDSPFAHVPYVFGRITLKGFDSARRRPRLAITLSDGQQNANRFLVGESGKYCFRRTSGGGVLMVEVDGIEVARRTLPSSGGSQQREDFEIFAEGGQRSSLPNTISAKFAHPPNERTADLYKKAIDAEKNKEVDKTISILKEIVVADPVDFIAWGQLGSLYTDQEKFPEADAALRRSLELRVDYTPAWINVGRLRIAQKQFEAATEILKHATELEPSSARAFQLLGEAYLQAKKGTLGAEALNQAITLDPIGMAEVHLQLAHLYQLAGANKLAAKEYKAFLTKMPEYKDKKKLEKFIKDNPE